MAIVAACPPHQPPLTADQTRTAPAGQDHVCVGKNLVDHIATASFMITIPGAVVNSQNDF